MTSPGMITRSYCVAISAERLRRALWLVLLLAAGTAWAGEAGRFLYVQGEVRVRAADGQERDARKGGALAELETVTTGPGGQAQLRMRDEALIALRPDTVFKIEAYRYGGAADGGERGILGLIKGGFRTITGLIGRQNRDSYRVETPTSTIGIRGTDHEPAYIPADGGWSGAPGAEPGTYDKVNSGSTFIETQAGLVEIGPLQAGFVPPRIDAVPVRLERIPSFYRPQPMVMGERRPPEAGRDGRSEGRGEGDSQGRGERNGPPPPGREGERPMGPPPPGEPAGPTPTNTERRDGLMPPPKSVLTLLPPLLNSTLMPLIQVQPPPSNVNVAETLVSAGDAFALAGGDKSGALIGAGAGMVGNGDNLNVLLGPSKNPVVVGDSGGNFTYLRDQSAMLDPGSLGVDDTVVRWGIYAGGTIVDQTTGKRGVDFFHFITAEQALPQAAIAGFSGQYTRIDAYTSPITESGWRTNTGTVSANFVINSGTLTALNLGVTDWQGRQWTATNNGTMSFAQFVSKGMNVIGSVGGATLNTQNSYVNGIPVGLTGAGLIGSYALHSNTGQAVTGSFLAR